MSGKQEEFAKKIFMQPIHLIDLTQCEDDELSQHILSGAVAVVMKHAYMRDMIILERAKQQLLQLIQQPHQHLLEDLLTYVFHVLGDDITLKQVYNYINKLSITLGDQTMSFADALIEQGYQKGEQVGQQIGQQLGLQQGKQIGLQEGVIVGTTKAIKQIAVNMINSGYSIEEITKVTNLSIDEIEALDVDSFAES